MPSKKKKNEQQSSKAANKAKAKLVEDKTFGMKNKSKSSKVQAQVRSSKYTSTLSCPFPWIHQSLAQYCKRRILNKNET